MKKILLIIALFGFCMHTYSQKAEGEAVYTKKELKQIAKEEKKAKQEAEKKQQKIKTELMLNSKKFVLEADHLSDGKGARIPVNSTLNFIGVDSANITLQLGTTSGAIGYNGVGGITADGEITKYDLKVTEGKRSKNYSLMINMVSPYGFFDITFLISETGSTSARISSTTSGKLEYYGRLVPINESRVYKGNTRY